MEFDSKKYNMLKTRLSFKNVNLEFFLNGINQLSSDWIITEQKIKKLNFCYYKLLTNVTKKTLRNSIYSNLANAINSITYVFKLVKNTFEIQKKVIKNLESLKFLLLFLKLNNKLYTKTNIKDIFSLNYTNNKLLLFQFLITNVKIIFKKKLKTK